MKNMSKENKNNRISSINFISFLAIICTVLSFHPNSDLQRIFSYGYVALWFLVIAFVVLMKQMKVDKLFIGMFAAFIICNIAVFWANSTGIYEVKSSVGIGMYLAYCTAFYFIGYNNSDSQDFGEWAIKAFCYSALAIVLITLFVGILEIQKNQLGQIFGSLSVILSADIFVLKIDKKRKYLYFSVMTLVAFMLFVNGARTSIIAALIVDVIMLAKTDALNKDKKIVFILVLIAAIIYFRDNSVINEMFGGYSEHTGKMTMSEAFKSSDLKEALNIVSNGRITIWGNAIKWFISSPLIGVGARVYVDNFVLNVLATGGLIYASLLLPITYGTMFNVYKSVDKIEFSDSKDKRFAEITRYLAIFYFIESLTEGYPPLGPGASSFFLWLLLGFYNGRRNIISEHCRN